MSALVLGRMQFALTISFHYIFPPLTIGLSLILVLLEGWFLRTGRVLYHQMARFWVKIFGLAFALGAASGVVMEFEFGTNWSAYSRYVGDVFGSPLAIEGVFAFFLESIFLGVLLFGWDRVSKKMHFVSTVLVCLGAHLSAVWITVANSWMQTPAGFHLVGEGLHARAEITSFWAMVFNPSAFDRLAHVFMSAWSTGAWLVVGVAAYYLLKKRHLDFAKSSIKMGLILAFLTSVGNFVTGDLSAKGVARHQPEKLAAMEGVFDPLAPADLNFFGWVHQTEEKVSRLKVPIPGLLSWLAFGDRRAAVVGLKAFPKEDWSPVNPVFQSFHLMVGLGGLLLVFASAGIFFWWRGNLFDFRPLLWIFVWAALGPQVANQAGWYTAEMGRQPWVVYHLLRTSAGLSKVVSARTILASLVMFTLIYALLLTLFVSLLLKKIRQGPSEEDPGS
jgi:cytochrome bd ubiquinol oxidase subunit I